VAAGGRAGRIGVVERSERRGVELGRPAVQIEGSAKRVGRQRTPADEPPGRRFDRHSATVQIFDLLARRGDDGTCTAGSGNQSEQDRKTRNFSQNHAISN
jgi:hypothetical protein